MIKNKFLKRLLVWFLVFALVFQNVSFAEELDLDALKDAPMAPAQKAQYLKANGYDPAEVMAEWNAGTTPPSDTTAPSGTTPPSDTTAPSGTTPPSDTAVPADTAAPSDTTAPSGTKSATEILREQQMATTVTYTSPNGREKRFADGHTERDMGNGRIEIIDKNGNRSMKETHGNTTVTTTYGPEGMTKTYDNTMKDPMTGQTMIDPRTGEPLAGTKQSITYSGNATTRTIITYTSQGRYERVTEAITVYIPEDDSWVIANGSGEIVYDYGENEAGAKWVYDEYYTAEGDGSEESFNNAYQALVDLYGEENVEIIPVDGYTDGACVNGENEYIFHVHTGGKKTETTTSESFTPRTTPSKRVTDPPAPNPDPDPNPIPDPDPDPNPIPDPDPNPDPDPDPNPIPDPDPDPNPIPDPDPDPDPDPYPDPELIRRTQRISTSMIGTEPGDTGYESHVTATMLYNDKNGSIILSGETCVHQTNKVIKFLSLGSQYTEYSWIETINGTIIPGSRQVVGEGYEPDNSVIGQETSDSNKKSHKVYVKLTGFEISGMRSFELLQDKEIDADAKKPTWGIKGEVTAIDGEPDTIRKGTIKVYCNCGENGKECCSKTFEVTFKPHEIEYKETVEEKQEQGEQEWKDYTGEKKDQEKHLTAVLEPDKTGYSGKDSLYTLGEAISLSGKNCIHVAESYKICTKDEIIRTKDKYLETYIDGVLVEGSKTYVGSETLPTVIGPVTNKKIEEKLFGKSYKVNVKFKGFSLQLPNGNVVDEYTCLTDKDLNSITLPVNAEAWKLGGKITNIQNSYYDKAKGCTYGIIEVVSDCCQKCKKEFKLYFGNVIPGEPVDLTVKISPNGGGQATVTGSIYNSTSKKYEEKSVTVTDKETIKVKPNSLCEITAKASSGYEYKWIVNRDGNIISKDNPATYQMPQTATTLIVYFEGNTPPPPGTGSKVTFVCDPIDGVTPLNVPANLSNVPAGKEVDMWTSIIDAYKSKYQFSKWYFTDSTGKIITPDSDWDKHDGTGSFIMPDYDIIVHAVPQKATTVKLTVYIEGEGNVLLDKNDMPSGTSKIVSKNKKLDLEALPKDGWKFVVCKDGNGNIININNFIIKEDTVLYFTFKTKGHYTLYVTSMEGGNAWTNGNSNHSIDTVIKTTDALGKTVYKIENVEEGENFYIYYDVDKNYEFGKWEYKPYITEKKENDIGKYTYITMPASDLTVTATFISKDIKDDPNLRVTSNNKVWGTAWTKINGKNTQMDKEYSVKSGTKLDLSRKSNTGYYFVNWKYSTPFSPFIGTNKIIMPDYDLEVMAMFAPIPIPEDGGETPPGSTPHKITFKAAPPEGGDVPEDLPAVYPGSKVTIGVTPNAGWEFDYWEVPDGVEIYYEPDGTGYFIMPDKDVVAIAHFKKAGTYKLYVTYTEGGTAWTYDVVGSPTTQTTYIAEAIPEMLYPIDYKVNTGYEFAGWEYRWATYAPGEKIDRVVNGVHKVIMPYSDLTVTAKFKRINQTGDYKLRVTSNNYLWGNAWVKVNGVWKSWKVAGKANASGEVGIKLEADKEYEVCFKEEPGYEFTNWVWTPDSGDYFIARNDKANTSSYTGYGKIKIPAGELKSDIELMAYFKPGEPNKEHTLTVKIDPTDAGKVYGGGKYKEGDNYTVSVDVKDGYEFKFWYYTADDGKVVKIYNEEFTGIMPNHDLTIIAACEKLPVPDPDDPDPEEYIVRVLVEGEGQVTGDVPATPEKDGEKEVKDGDSVTITAKPKPGSKFVGWKLKGEIVSASKTEKFTVDGEDMVITACFVPITQSDISDGFKIISVRDLRWQDYFVKGKSLTGKYFGIPQSGVMLKGVDKYPEVIKMGYAVEFELSKLQTNPEDLALVITPELYDKNGKIAWDDVKDYMVSSSGSKISEDFKKIVIYGDNRNTAYKTKYQTSVTSEKVDINGVQADQTKWTWLYYLPADIGYSNYKTRGDEITVRFTIQLHKLNAAGKYIEPTSSNNGTVIEDLVVFEQNYNGVGWEGDVYKYSKTHSLLEDIYNNATN